MNSTAEQLPKSEGNLLLGADQPDTKFNILSASRKFGIRVTEERSGDSKRLLLWEPWVSASRFITICELGFDLKWTEIIRGAWQS